MNKKIILAVLLVTSIFFLRAQNIIYKEVFDNGIPADYKTYDLDGLDQQPGAFSINYKGKGWLGTKGSASSISFYNPIGKSNDWMVTRAISIPAVEAGNKILLAWQETTPDYNYRDSYNVYINEKDQEVGSFSTNLYNSSSTQTSTFIRYITIDISAYANKNIYLAFQNDADDKYILYIDNITIIQAPKNGLATMNIDNVVYNKVNSEVNINGSILNFGWDTLRSFQFNYQLDNGPIQKTMFAGLNFPSFLGDRYTSSYKLNVPFGNHLISFWGSDINGEPKISNISTMNVYGYRPKDYITRQVLLEQFTSSSCIPCELGNKKVKKMIEELTDKPIVVKYQQDFPGEGDPYCTDETFNRSLYYEINNIPYT
ncbi:MAG TPA: choice-of-anchor J domain-containing protein, partial [Saprospiraceae bacterium]|nr:choice-of-anchor J domain-containing protein [Saprospiraceae bacterium]